LIITAAPATADQVDDLRAIFEVLADAIREGRGGSLQIAEREANIVEHLNAIPVRGRPWVRSDRRVFAVTLDAAVVGVAAVSNVVQGATLLGVIDGYGVLEDARGVGVGEELLGAVMTFCADAGCVGVDADALPGARETKNFFETFGFTARRLVVHHRFGTEPILQSGPDEHAT
jgi:GNAT superfamily N-acetyltransferase